MKFDDPPAATAKTPVIRRVTLKEILRKEFAWSKRAEILLDAGGTLTCVPKYPPLRPRTRLRSGGLRSAQA
jgi:hypothetical protein